MAEMIVRKFSSAEETRRFPHGRIELIATDEGTIGKATLEQGWKWSRDLKPSAGTASCEVAHAGYCLSGRMAVRSDDGEEAHIGPGDFFVIPPGHDAWTEGDEPCVVLDWAGMSEAARQGAGRTMATMGTAERPPAQH